MARGREGPLVTALYMSVSTSACSCRPRTGSECFSFLYHVPKCRYFQGRVAAVEKTLSVFLRFVDYKTTVLKHTQRDVLL